MWGLSDSISPVVLLLNFTVNVFIASLNNSYSRGYVMSFASVIEGARERRKKFRG